MSKLDNILAILRGEAGGQFAIPGALVDSLISADGEQKAAEENLQRLATYNNNVANFMVNVHARPDLPFKAPVRPNKIVFVGLVRKDTTGTGMQGHPREMIEQAYNESDELLGAPIADHVPPAAPPVGIVKIGTLQFSRGAQLRYSALQGDTVEDGVRIVHPLTNQTLVKRFTPFGGYYEVI